MILIKVNSWPGDLETFYSDLDKCKIPGEKREAVLQFGNAFRKTSMELLASRIMKKYVEHFNFVDIIEEPDYQITYISDVDAEHLQHSGRQFLGFTADVDKKWAFRKEMKDVDTRAMKIKFRS